MGIIHFTVDATLVGKTLILRVKGTKMRIFNDDRLLVIYQIPAGKGNLIQKKRFYEALRKDHKMNKRKYNHSRLSKGRAKHTISPLKSLYEMDVEVRPLHIYDNVACEVRI